MNETIYKLTIIIIKTINYTRLIIRLFRFQWMRNNLDWDLYATEKPKYVLMNLKCIIKIFKCLTKNQIGDTILFF